MPYFVYCLLGSDNSTYIGATVDLDRRLRQHNGEIKGGAKVNINKVQNGVIFIRAAHIEGFPTWNAALEFEWRWKQITRQIHKYNNPIHRRMIALKQLLSLKKSTQKAIPFSEWETPPIVILEDDETRQLYNNVIN